MIERFLLILVLIKSSLRGGAHHGNRYVIHKTVPPPPAAVVAGVTCELDPVCFKYAIDCTFNADDIEPFYREAHIDCLECSALCELYRNESAHSPYYCRSAIWDACDKTCDLFAIKAPSIKILAKHRGRIYLQPSDNCKYPPAPTPPPVVTEPPIRIIPSCPNVTDVAKMIGVKNQLFQNMTGEQLLGVSDERACAEYCLHNQFPNGTASNCKSAQFLNGICTISRQEAISSEQLVQSDTGIYYQKFCFPRFKYLQSPGHSVRSHNFMVKSTFEIMSSRPCSMANGYIEHWRAGYVENCPDIFLEEPHMILVGIDKKTVDAVSLEACMKMCVTSAKRYGFVCKSIMFYYQDLDQNCILNEETRSTKKDLFVPAPEDDEVSYVEVGCHGTANERPTEGPGTLSHRDVRHYIVQKENVQKSSNLDAPHSDRSKDKVTTKHMAPEGRRWRTTKTISKITPAPTTQPHRNG